MTATIDQGDSPEEGCGSGIKKAAAESSMLNGSNLSQPIGNKLSTTQQTFTTSSNGELLKSDQMSITSGNTITPHPPSSKVSSCSDTKATSKGKTTTLSKFKEKRPEPLNLAPTLNQDIPLDLSVKSAGNVPSGESVFNLLSAGQMTTLETPRIAWHDNEALLLKQRLFSTSASQRTRLSSLAGDSPPLTPISPFLDFISSPTSKSAYGYFNSISNPLQESASSLHWLMSAHNQHRQQQKLDFPISNWSNNRLSPSSKFYSHQLNDDGLAKAPRRSCSTDSLNMTNITGGNYSFRNHRTSLYSQQNSAEGKKNPISPLALKNFSISEDKSDHFSYNTGQLSGCAPTNTERELEKKDQSPDISTNEDVPMNDVYCLTPTSVSNATKNLLNIHLNSPTLAQGGVSFESIFQANLPKNSNSYSTPLDQSLVPILSDATRRQEISVLNSSASIVPSKINYDKLNTNPSSNNQCLTTSLSRTHNIVHPPSSCSTTLNTPTLVSPSQLKTGFLPSPTLSPMSSMFELPSPLIMFQSSNQNSDCIPQVEMLTESSKSSKQDLVESFLETKKCIEPALSRKHEVFEREPQMQSTQHTSTLEGKASADVMLNKQDIDQIKTQHTNLNCSNLSHLVTPAKEKIKSGAGIHNKEFRMMESESIVVANEDVSMTFEESLRGERMEEEVIGHEDDKASTIIPTILVSNCLAMQQQKELLLHSQIINQHPQQHKKGKDYRKLSLSKSDEIQYRENQKPDSSFPKGASQVLGTNYQQRSFRNIVDKRALSPSSFKTQISHYYNERLESSSAPPEIHEVRRSKLKSATDSGTTLKSQRNEETSFMSNQASQRQHLAQASQTNIHSKTNAPYPEVHHNWRLNYPNSSSCGEYKSLNCYDGPRSSSAEPLQGQIKAVQFSSNGRQNYFQITDSNKSQQLQQQTPRNLYELSGFGCNFSQSAQHLDTNYSHCKSSPESIPHNQHHPYQYTQQQSVSLVELYKNSPSLNQSDSFAPAEFHQINSNQSTSASTHDPHHLMNSSSTIEFRNSFHQSSSPPTSSNQAVVQGEKGTQLQLNTRALSADLRCLSKSDSSCNSADFCFRSNSVTSATAGKKYNCDLCPRAFTRSDMLTRHKRLHSGDRPFQCNECKQEFSRSDHLSTHMRTHTGEKPYKCKVCSYSACRKDMITRHMKVHNRSSPLELAR